MTNMFVYVCLLFLFPSCFFPFATKNTHVAARVFNGDQWQKPKFVQIQWLKLVGGLEQFFIFPYIGNNNPNWLIFFRGVGQPPTSKPLHNTCFCSHDILFTRGLGGPAGAGRHVSCCPVPAQPHGLIQCDVAFWFNFDIDAWGNWKC